MKRLFLILIRAYQRFISPGLPRRCRYEPTCSAYAAQAIRELGPARGTLVAMWRLARCNPFSNGGLDPLEARRLFPDCHQRHVVVGGGPARRPSGERSDGLRVGLPPTTHHHPGSSA